MQPKPFLGYYPATIPQTELDEAVVVLGSSPGEEPTRFTVGPPKTTEPLAPRDNYETAHPRPLSDFGPIELCPIGDVFLARSGDKGANVNLGLFVHTPEEWDWLRSFFTSEKMKELMGDDWRNWFWVERVEMPRIFAIHFVIYGPLGRGISSSRLLDGLGKGFGEFIRAVHVPIPVKFLSQE